MKVSLQKAPADKLVALPRINGAPPVTPPQHDYIESKVVPNTIPVHWLWPYIVLLLAVAGKVCFFGMFYYMLQFKKLQQSQLQLIEKYETLVRQSH